MAPDVTAEYVAAVAGMARTQCQQGDATGALALIEQAVARVGEHPDLMAARACSLHEQARYQEALGAWRQVAEQCPLEPLGWVGMAKALYAMGRREGIESLVEDYLRVLGDRPDRNVRAAHVALAGRRSSIFEALRAGAGAG